MGIQLKFRPACIFACIFLVSLYVSSLFYSDVKIIITASVVIGFIASTFCHFVFFKESTAAHHSFVTFIFLLALALALILSYFAFDIGYHRKTQQISGEREIELVITQVNYSSDNGTSLYGVITSCDDTPCRVNTLLEASFKCEYQPSDKIKVKANIRPSCNGYSLSDKYSISKGIYTVAECDESQCLEYISKQHVFPETAVSSLRGFLSDTFEEYLDGYSLALIKAVIYGDKSELDHSTTQVFADLGISHTLAISGLHMGIIIAFATIALKLFKIQKKKRSVLILIFGLIYILMAGLAPSVCRTYIMFAFMIAGDFTRRRRDHVTSLLIAVMLICIISPRSIFDVGLHLSFFSTLGILVYALPIDEEIRSLALFRPIKWVLSLCVMTACANLFTLPYSIFFFGSISLISPISNLIFIPLITVLVYLGSLIVICSFAPIIAKFIAYGVSAVTYVIRFIVTGCYGISRIFLLPLDSENSTVLGAAVCTAIFIMLMKGASRTKVFALMCTYLILAMVLAVIL